MTPRFLGSVNLSDGDWPYHEEEVAADKTMWSFGYGEDLAAEVGGETVALGKWLLGSADKFTDGGANLVVLLTADQPLRIYVRRRKRLIDAGTRKDFESLGWGKICDLLDEA